MERPLLRAIASGLVGLASLGSLALISASPSSSPKPSAGPENGWRLLEPVTYENLTVFPVAASFDQDTSAFLTLDEGLTTGEVTVSEEGAAGLARSRNGRPIPLPQYNSGASVNQLVLINRSKRPLLLLAGELVSGGKQDRIIGKDRIVAPGADPLPLDVFCVEHGRWTGASAEFSESKTIVHPSVREQAAVAQNQDEVWDAVRVGSKAKAATSVAGAPPAAAARIDSGEIASVMTSEAPTQSYKKIYESHRVSESVDGFVDEMQRRFSRATSGLKGERVVGVVVAYGGEIAWSDIFASGELFHQYWSKLLRSYAVEALARPTFRETASVENAREFLRPLRGREVQETEAGVYRWRETTEGRLALIELDALQPKPMTVHRLLLHRTS